MRKTFIQLIPATLLLFCSACGKGEMTTPMEESSSSSSLLPNIMEERILPQPDPDIWNVQGVDISEISPHKKLISFTFDDAPGRTIENLLAVFADFNEKNPDCKASASLFVNGCRFDNQTPHLLHAACLLGWELGNHTYSHAQLTRLTPTEIQQEIDNTDRLLEPIDAQPRHLLRAPFGSVNEQVREQAYTPIIDWTIDTLDWTGSSPMEIHERVFTQKYDGAIVLMHDGYEQTVEAVKTLLPDLKQAGYQVVSVSKIIKAHGCTFRRGQVYIRARKTS